MWLRFHAMPIILKASAPGDAVTLPPVPLAGQRYVEGCVNASSVRVLPFRPLALARLLLRQLSDDNQALDRSAEDRKLTREQEERQERKPGKSITTKEERKLVE